MDQELAAELAEARMRNQLGISHSRAYPGRRRAAQAEAETEDGDAAKRRGAERAQGPPRSEETQTDSESVAELKERGEG